MDRKKIFLIATTVNIVFLVAVFLTSKTTKDAPDALKEKVSLEGSEIPAFAEIVHNQQISPTAIAPKVEEETSSAVAPKAEKEQEAPLELPLNTETAKEEYYIVKPGDNPWTIAKKNHMRVEDLLRLNNMDQAKAKKLRPGDRLRIQ